MAVIQKIRNRYGKIAGGVIAIALISFIVSDARNGSFGGIFGSHDNTVVTVNGTKVDSKEYETRVKEYETLTAIYSNRGPIDDAARAQIREQVLQSVAYESVVNNICDKMGIITSEQEKKDMIYGANASPLVRQFQIEGRPVFVNPDTKQFDPNIVKELEKELAQNAAKIDPYGKLKEQWETVKTYVVRMARIDKFNAMMASSVYAPVYAATRAAANANQQASIRYIKVPYATLSDTDFKVTDDDIKAFMEKHKALFETEQETRSVDYVSFDIIPASADTARAVGSLNEIKEEFAKTKDNQTFCGNKSDDPSAYSEAFVSKATFGSRYADTIMSQPVGTVYGPYFENGGFKLTKVVDKKELPDSAKCRHILVKIKEGQNEILSDSAAKKRIDSVVVAINSGVPFDTMVVKVSNDYNAQNPNPKGEYTFTLQQRPTISKAFGDFIFEGHVGEKKVVKADNSKTGGYVGYHYIEILEQKGMGPTMQVATIVKSLAPSDSTVNAIFGKANEFAAKSPNAAEFDANLKKMGVDKRVADNVKENSFSMQGLGPAREVIKWMYTHKVGEVSNDPFHLGDQRYVVAKLTNIQPKGMMAVTANNRPPLEQRVREEKKAEAIAKKYAGQNLEAIAQAISGQVAQSDSVLLSGAMIPGLGYEPKIVGYSFNPSFQLNTVSPGIKGQGGVYFITVLSRTTKPADQMAQQMGVMQERRQEEMQMRNYLGQMLQQSMLKGLDIKYNSANF